MTYISCVLGVAMHLGRMHARFMSLCVKNVFELASQPTLTKLCCTVAYDANKIYNIYIFHMSLNNTQLLQPS